MAFGVFGLSGAPAVLVVVVVLGLEQECVTIRHPQEEAKIVLGLLLPLEHATIIRAQVS